MRPWPGHFAISMCIGGSTTGWPVRAWEPVLRVLLPEFRLIHFGNRVVVGCNLQQPVTCGMSNRSPGGNPGFLRHVAISKGTFKIGVGHVSWNPGNCECTGTCVSTGAFKEIPLRFVRKRNTFAAPKMLQPARCHRIRTRRTGTHNSSLNRRGLQRRRQISDCVSRPDGSPPMSEAVPAALC